MKCFICGNEISGQYYIDPYNRVACNRHELYYCFSCKRFCRPNESHKILQYGYFCPDCQKRIVDASSVVRIAKFVNEYYLKHKISIPDYSLKLISEDQMCIEANSNALGLAYNRNPYEIHIIRHLSRTAFAGVLAHEVLHLWQYKHNLSPMSLLCEGMCELGSYLMLKEINKIEADTYSKGIEVNEDKIYGNGFRLLHSIYLKFGWKGVIQALLLRNETK